MRTIRIDEGHLFDIGESRSTCVKMGLSVEEVKAFLFVDDDMIPENPDTLLDMWDFLEGDPDHRHIVSGLYYEQGWRNRPLLMFARKDPKDGKLRFHFPFTDKDIEKGSKKMVKVDIVPAGFLLVRREVFEKLEWPPFYYNSPELRALFPPEVKGIGEDVYFSFKAKAAGYDLWVDCRHPILHFGASVKGPQWLIDEYNETATMKKQVALTQTALKNEQLAVEA